MAQRAQRPQILLVDDDAQVTGVFARMLRLGGYDVNTAADVGAARACVRQKAFDAMLVDFHLPEINGLAFIREVRASTARPYAAAAIITGDYALDPAIGRDAQMLGVPIVFKPLWCDGLIEVVASLIPNRPNERDGAAVPAQGPAGPFSARGLEAAPDRRPPRVSPQLGDAGQRRVMVVDDDHDARAMTMHLLDLSGFQTEGATNGAEALAKLRAASTMPDLILVDLMMPIMDGRTLRAHLERDPRLSGIPVVVLSSVANDQSIDNVAAILRKPCDPDRLILTLHGVCLRHGRQPDSHRAN